MARPTERELVVGVDGVRCWRSAFEIPMRDGVQLVADLYEPDREGNAPRPVILERTPYGRRLPRASEQYPGIDRPLTPAEVAAYLTGSDFIVVMQDCRGRGDSQGEFTKYLCEGEDGFDTVEWLGSQDWCDGRVFTMGLSYGAHVQAALASLRPKHLSGMLMDCGGFASAYEAGCRQGGAFELKQVTWAIRHAAKSREAAIVAPSAADLSEDEIWVWIRLWPWEKGKSPISYAPSYEEYLLEQNAESSFTNYWKQVGLYGRGYYSQFPDVPSVHISGWYDPYTMTAVDNFSGLSRAKTSAVYLVLGPWTHGARSTTHAGEVDFGSASTLESRFAPNYLAFRQRWFRSLVSGSSQDLFSAAVEFFLMGGGGGRLTDAGRLFHGGRWETSPQWPPVGVESNSWYLHPGGVLSPQNPDVDEDYVEYEYDPRRPFPTVGGAITSGEPLMRGGAYDQVWVVRNGSSKKAVTVPLELREDSVCFESEPLLTDVAVVGRPSLHLWISSSATDTDLYWKLLDVYPPSSSHPHGFAMNITDAIFRCRYRDGFENPQAMVPNVVYPLVVQAPDTANLFCRGHRIRILIASSNFPRFDINRNVWPDEHRSRISIVARNRVHLGGRFSSHVELPVWGKHEGNL
ncbi:CocE/NonD family hydrolase [Ferrimicrobium sp.]|uniref:CocE/NonD family hydrolase n=1 Tax=Ferrimicrobium sp. TaxID=2926050 RepID=UPI0026261544|nr:CocE/NonD family hydrolase [Ferrimicrobium sp.]